jgi:drug/metabolite transporter (DMT)-like permease
MPPSSPATPAAHSRGAIVLGYLVIYVVWGSTYLAIRVGVETLPPLLMAGTRFAVAGLILYAWRRLRGDARPAPRAWGPALLVGGLMLFLGNGLVSWAEHRGIDSGTAALLVATTPLWVALVDWARPGGVRPTIAGAAGLLLGFAGAGLLVGPQASAHAPGGTRPIWAMAVILAAFSWAIGGAFHPRWGRRCR